MPDNNAWPKAIIFDLDGTLIDSVPDLAGALNTLLDNEAGHPALPQDKVRVMIGNGVTKLIERGLKAHGAAHDAGIVSDLVPKFMDIYLPRATRETYIYKGGAQMLKSLRERGIKIGLCTNKPTDVSIRILTDLGIAGYFSSIIGGTSGHAPKPDPAPMLACLDELGVAAKEALFVGDSTADVKTARNTNMPVVVMSYGYTAIPAAELGGDLVIDTLGEVWQAARTLSAA